MSNRAARRRAAREADRPFAPSSDQTIVLKNPVAQHFAAFAVGNATICQKLPPHQPGEKCDSPDCSVVVQQGSAVGQHLILCGAGPSLRDTAAEWCPKGDQIWGCNSALLWLQDQGYKPTHGFTVDQTPQMVEEWAHPPDVEYLIASTVHPHLTEWLITNDRKTRFFHNYVGIQGEDVEYDGERMSYEDWMYCALFPATVRVGSGLNSVNRALDLAIYMGFEKITVLGADCSLQVNAPPPVAAINSPEHRKWLTDHVVMHANGDGALAHGATAVTLEGYIDGRFWLSKPDMIISAVWLAKAAQHNKGRVQLIGDTLPNALIDKPDEFLKRLPHMTKRDGEALPIVFT
jgi:hypothetical protein